jgi:hypothetical protein
MASPDRVRVVFVDAADGSEIGRADVPYDQLPETFEVQTTLELGDAQWAVERAEPPTAAQFIRSRGLVLTLRRIELVAPGDILFSLPTICDVVPSTSIDAVAGVRAGLSIAEDDWRQVELVDAGLIDVVHEEFRAIREIYDQHAHVDAEGHPVGFRQIHVRTRPGEPLPRPVPRPAGASLGPVGLHGQPGAVPGSFTLAAGPATLYGLADGDDVSVLAAAGDATEVAAVLGAFMQANALVLVDWCRCAVTMP